MAWVAPGAGTSAGCYFSKEQRGRGKGLGVYLYLRERAADKGECHPTRAWAEAHRNPAERSWRTKILTSIPPALPSSAGASQAQDKHNWKPEGKEAH